MSSLFLGIIYNWCSATSQAFWISSFLETSKDTTQAPLAQRNASSLPLSREAAPWRRRKRRWSCFENLRQDGRTLRRAGWIKGTSAPGRKGCLWQVGGSEKEGDCFFFLEDSHLNNTVRRVVCKPHQHSWGVNQLAAFRRWRCSPNCRFLKSSTQAGEQDGRTIGEQLKGFLKGAGGQCRLCTEKALY